jgi:hypothetical protein
MGKTNSTLGPLVRPGAAPSHLMPKLVSRNSPVSPQGSKEYLHTPGSARSSNENLMRVKPYQSAKNQASNPLQRAQASAATPRFPSSVPGTPRSMPALPRDPIATPRRVLTGDGETFRVRGEGIAQTARRPATNLSWGHESQQSAKGIQQSKDDGQVLVIDKMEHEILQDENALKRRFLEKNEAKMPSFQDIFRKADVNKMGSIGREELALALEKVDFDADPQVIEHLLTTRASDKERLSFHDFMRFFDDRSGNMCLLKRPPPEMRAFGDCSKMTHLWLPVKAEAGSREVGTLNDVLVCIFHPLTHFHDAKLARRQHTVFALFLTFTAVMLQESDKIEDGHMSERLDGNFSGVQYNILNFNSSPPIPKTLVVPLKKRVTLFSSHPSGRRVSFDHGDTPWNVVSMRTPRTNKRTTFNGKGVLDNSWGGDSWRRQTLTTNVPVFNVLIQTRTRLSKHTHTVYTQSSHLSLQRSHISEVWSRMLCPCSHLCM